VEDISFTPLDRRVTQIDYTAGGKRYSQQADVVIICAGALGTPIVLKKLLDSLSVESQSVGTGFIDHPMGFVGKIKIKKEHSGAMKKFAAWDRGDYVSRSAIRLKSICGRYTACAFLRPALTMGNRLEIYKYKSALGAGSGLDRLKAMFSWKLFHPDILAEIVAHLTGKPLPSRIYNMLLIADQKRGDNRVYEKDGRIHVDWTISDEEIQIYRQMLIDLKGMLSEITDDININTEITSDWLWSAAHHSGTVSVGSAEDALLDTNLKLKCCDNVYVCDGSVLQEHSYANTGLAIGQLALRLADRLKHEY
jgi:choline dehydrogenase-like flavoprotein